MNGDPFYRQLVKVMQDTGREVASTRQSARYKDELQTSKASASTVIKLKARKRYKVEMPVDASSLKVDRICSIINKWTLQKRREFLLLENGLGSVDLR